MQTNLGLFLSKRAQLSPKVEAVVEVEKGRRFTYAELDARANRIAHVLRAKGVRKGDRVALLLMNGVEYLEAYFGAAKIGAVIVPINWRLVPDEMAFILKDSGSGRLWTRSDSQEEMSWARADEYCTRLRLGGQQSWRLPTMEELESLFMPELRNACPFL